MEHTAGRPRISGLLLICWHADHGTQSLAASHYWEQQVHILTNWLHLTFLRCWKRLNIGDGETESTAVGWGRTWKRRVLQVSPACCKVRGSLAVLPVFMVLGVCQMLPHLRGENTTLLNPCKFLFCESSSNKAEIEREISKQENTCCVVSFFEHRFIS